MTSPLTQAIAALEPFARMKEAIIAAGPTATQVAISNAGGTFGYLFIADFVSAAAALAALKAMQEVAGEKWLADAGSDIRAIPATSSSGTSPHLPDDKADIDAATEALKEYEAEGGISLEEMMRELEKGGDGNTVRSTADKSGTASPERGRNIASPVLGPDAVARAREFSSAAFKGFGLSPERLDQYAMVIAELIQGALDEDRRQRSVHDGHPRPDAVARAQEIVVEWFSG